MIHFIPVVPVQTEEQSVIQRVHPDGSQTPYHMKEIADETPVKSLKILAQICVDELKRCNESEMQAKVFAITENDSIYISSDSESDTSSTSSSRRGVITGGIKKPGCSETESSTGKESSSESSSSDSDDSDDDEESANINTDKNEEEFDQLQKEPNLQQKHLPKNDVVQKIVNEWSGDSDACEKSPPNMNTEVNTSVIVDVKDSPIVENVANEVYNPDSLKNICREVLLAHSMIIRYEVPTLKYLCEHSLATAGMEIPLICFVPDESYEYMSTDQQSSDDGVYICLDNEFDETELANLFNGANNCIYESIEVNKGEAEENRKNPDKASLIDQCVALQNILSSPPPEDNQPKGSIEILSDETAFYMDTNGFHDSIQYEETVLPSDNNAKGSLAAIAAFKKDLQKKYVHPSIYHKRFAINKLLRKYKVHQVSFFNKKSIVQKHLNKTLVKFRQRSKENRKPKKLATRRSARIADKIKQQKCDGSDLKAIEKLTKFSKVNKNSKSDLNKLELTENKRLCKIMNVSDLIQNSGVKGKPSEADKESITREILKLIAQKRTLKRKLSICHRPNLSFDDDGYCYDEDGQISDMLSSFINTGFEGKKSSARKSRSRRASVEHKLVKEQGNKKKKVPIPSIKKAMTAGDKNKAKNLQSKEKNLEQDIVPVVSEDSKLSSIENSITNKTDIKGAAAETTISSLPTKAAVKEIIPAKRTRFLSIDGSLMKYGIDRKKETKVKSFKATLELPEITKRKVPSQKLSKVNIDENTVKINTETKDKNVVHEDSKPESPIELKTVQKTLPAQKPQNKVRAKDSNDTKEAQTLIHTKPPKELPTNKKSELKVDSNKLLRNPMQKSITIPETKANLKDTGKNIGTPQSRNPNTTCSITKVRVIENILEKEQPISKANSPEYNNNRKLNVKPTKNEQEKPLSERYLCSTMVSPLKIIIEPKRALLLAQEKTIAIDPLASDKSEQSSPKSIESPPVKPAVAKKEIRKTRFSERINTHDDQVLAMGGDFTEKQLKFQNKQVSVFPLEQIKKKSETSLTNLNGAKETVKKTPTSMLEQKFFTKTEANAIMKSYLDIETLLPSTKIPQPKPARRCLSRAQTISHSVSPYSHSPYEPMKLRSSNSFWNRRNIGFENESNISPYNLKFKSIEGSFTIPKRKPTINPVTSESNVTKALKKTPIDISTYPVPESLQIPSIDLRSQSSPFSSLSSSSLPFPIPMPLRKPINENKEIMKGTCNSLELINFNLINWEVENNIHFRFINILQ